VVYRQSLSIKMSLPSLPDSNTNNVQDGEALLENSAFVGALTLALADVYYNNGNSGIKPEDISIVGISFT